MVNNDSTVSVENIVKKLFTKHMDEQELYNYFSVMHGMKTDFHIHNNILSEYVYNNYEQVNLTSSQSKEVYWQENIDNLGSMLDSLVNEALRLDRIENVEKTETLKLYVNNGEAIKELAPKMKEHISLALLQYKTFIEKINTVEEQAEKISSKMNDAKNDLDKTSNLLNDAKNDLDKTSNLLKDSTGNFISILGIYSALIFGVFGGFDAFKSIFSNMKDTPISTVLIESSILMIGLMILTFILLQSIGILSGRTYLACGHKNTKDCNCSFAKRYPIFSLSLNFFGSVLVLGCIIHILNSNGIVYKSYWKSLVLIFGGIVILSMLIYNIYYSFKIKHK